MEAIVIPQVALHRVTASDAVDFLVDASERHDSEHRGVSVIMQLPSDRGCLR